MKYILLAAYLMTGCKDQRSGGKGEADRVRVGVLNGPAAVSIVQMMERGKLTAGEIPIEFIIRSEPGQIQSLMFHEEVDFAFLPSTTAAILYNSGFNYQAIVVPLWGSMYLVGSDPAITTVRDLRGKSVGQMGRGVVPDIVLRYILIQSGLEPDEDVRIDYNFPSHIELASAVKAGITSLGVLSEPQVSLIINQNPRLGVMLDLTREWCQVTGDSIPFAQTVMMVGNTFSRNNSRIVDQFLEDFRKNIEWINMNPAGAAALIVKHRIIPDSIAAKACIPRCNLRYKFAADEKKGVMDFYKVLFNLNMDAVGGRIPDENFFYTK
ncbi:MAG TPA: PhnD/SsuA/transferrin family substrate-binding protein [Cyclobacteriaceae bacterium]|nr:PhnD/SsuA/transferrin family substrate-binding protein [Cyclobacteriaceae bacterium]